MFRPDRIGTPTIHTSQITNSTLDWTPQQATIQSGSNPYNVINGTAVADFGHTQLNWTGTESITGGNKFSLVQQFTITKPLSGDVRGVELNFAIKIVGPSSMIFVPTFFRLTAAEASLLAGSASSYDQPTLFHPDYVSNNLPLTTTANWHFASYRNQVIVKNDPTLIGGTYAHGFQMFDGSGGAVALSGFHCVASVRQLNDQQNVGYADTLR